MLDDLGGGGADDGRSGFGITGADFGQRGAQAACSGDNEVPAPDSRYALFLGVFTEDVASNA